MKKVTCIGFHATGSGAVDDYLREFPCFKMAISNYECRLLHDPDGISDLEYNLVQNPNRLNSGFAIKRFKIFAQRQNRFYSTIFGSDWLKLANEYADSLVDFTFKGWWHMDPYLLPKHEYLFFKFRRAINKFMPKPFKKNRRYNYLPKIDSYHVDITEDEFLSKTKAFVEKLCLKIQDNQNDYCVIDQMMPPTNLVRYFRYVDDLQAIVVDRDPRDIFISHTKLYKEAILPTDVYEYAKAYRAARKMISELNDEKKVLKLQFEDLIYKYDETTAKIDEFLGLSKEQHVGKFEHFNPNISIKNTKLWEKYPQYMEEIKILEKELPEFLYKYDN